jgi:hypothetical protein
MMAPFKNTSMTHAMFFLLRRNPNVQPKAWVTYVPGSHLNISSPPKGGEGESLPVVLIE